jgi:hypothetical protein
MFKVAIEYFRFSMWKPGRTAPMSNLTARFVPPGEEDVHKLPESGWYAFNDKNIPAEDRSFPRRNVWPSLQE